MWHRPLQTYYSILWYSSGITSWTAHFQPFHQLHWQKHRSQSITVHWWYQAYETLYNTRFTQSKYQKQILYCKTYFLHNVIQWYICTVIFLFLCHVMSHGFVFDQLREHIVWQSSYQLCFRPLNEHLLYWSIWPLRNYSFLQKN